MSVFDWLSVGADVVSSGADAYLSVKAIGDAKNVEKPEDVKSQTPNQRQNAVLDAETKNAILKAKQSEVDRNTMMNAFLMRKMANESRLKKDNTLIYIVGGVCVLGLMLVTINSMNKN